MPTVTAVHHRWKEMPRELIGERIARRFITGERITLAHFELKRGASVKSHGHEAEEMLCVLSGSVKITTDGAGNIIREGEVIHIPDAVPHEVEALEDSAILDIFSPIRQDWLDKTDTYFPR